MSDIRTFWFFKNAIKYANNYNDNLNDETYAVHYYDVETSKLGKILNRLFNRADTFIEEPPF